MNNLENLPNDLAISTWIPKEANEELLKILGPHGNRSSLIRSLILDFIKSNGKKQSIEKAA